MTRSAIEIAEEILEEWGVQVTKTPHQYIRDSIAAALERQAIESWNACLMEASRVTIGALIQEPPHLENGNPRGNYFQAAHDMKSEINHRIYALKKESK